MKVWIDQDLCTGDGLCEEIAPAVFTLLDDGLAYVKEGERREIRPRRCRRNGPSPLRPRECRHRSLRGVPGRMHLHRVVACPRATLDGTQSGLVLTPLGPHFLGADDGIRTRDPHLGKVLIGLHAIR